MIAYPITEGELDTVGLLNTISSICLSAGSAFIGFGLSIAVQGLFEQKLTETAKVMIFFVFPLFAILGMLLFFAAWLAYGKKGSTLSKMKAESKRRAE